MTSAPNVPILMGVYRFPRLLTSKSEPAILGVLPGRVWLTGQGGVFFDAPTDQITAKANSTVGHVTLQVDGTKHIIAGVGSAKGGPFSPEQLQELQDSHHLIASGSVAQSLMAARALFIGTPGKVDGSYHGGLQSMAGREIGQQRDFGAAMRELLTAMGVKL